MKHSAPILLTAALAFVLPACAGDAGPELGRVAQAVNEVDVHSIPADLMSCDAFYGQDWDTPDRLIRVKGRSGQVVLVQEQEMVCSGRVDLLASRLPGVDLGTLIALNGVDDALGQGGQTTGGESAESPVGDSNPLPARPSGDESAESPVDDSNPLPAHPTGNASASSAGPIDDSNPLPASPLGSQSASASGPADDSNPLPARPDTEGDGPEYNGPVPE